MIVVDASVVVAALVDSGPVGDWALSHFDEGGLVAPDHVFVETANALRRAAAAGDISADVAAMAHATLSDLPLSVQPYDAVADRCWELRDNLTIYDAAYVALAEVLEAPLATLDHRIAKAPGVRCEFLLAAP